MKGITKFAVFLMFLFSGAVLSANTGDNPGIEIKALTYAPKVSVTLNDLKGSTEVRLIDEEGHVLIRETVENQASFRKILNLEKLEEGKYFLIVATDSKEIMQPINLTPEALIVDASQRKTYLVPTIKVGENYVDVMWLNNQVADMKVSFVDNGAGRTVFVEEIKNQLKVEKRYDVSNLERGSYTVVVSTPRHTHYQRLVVK